MNFTLMPGQLSLADLRLLMNEQVTITLAMDADKNIQAAENVVTNILKENKVVYGINTGFGSLAHTKIAAKYLDQLQRSIVLSHAAGTGELICDAVVRLILLLKINSLARGFSGVKLSTIQALIQLFNSKIYPCIPSQGSVGASGDLAPLAHLSIVLLGVGTARYQGKIIAAEEALSIANLKPIVFAPKEGLALLNGTQVSTALALYSLFAIENVFVAALTAGALSVEAARGSTTPFDARIQLVRGHQTQIQVATWLRHLLNGSEIGKSHIGCKKVQDPYSLRCQPQVMGACLAHILYVSNTLLIESNAVSDNPLVFAEQQDVISGGNFHAEPIALAADALAVCIAEIAGLSERRIALLMDPHFSQLPPFLVSNAGVNSGFMIAQVTAAALVSENKSLAHPASVDSIPTSANQEDHVSMATYGARRLLMMVENALGVIGIELLAACQGIDFLRPLKSSPPLEKIYSLIRKNIDYFESDRYFAPDITIAKELIRSGEIQHLINIQLF